MELVKILFANFASRLRSFFSWHVSLLRCSLCLHKFYIDPSENYLAYILGKLFRFILAFFALFSILNSLLPTAIVENKIELPIVNYLGYLFIAVLFGGACYLTDKLYPQRNKKLSQWVGLILLHSLNFAFFVFCIIVTWTATGFAVHLFLNGVTVPAYPEFLGPSEMRAAVGLVIITFWLITYIISIPRFMGFSVREFTIFFLIIPYFIIPLSILVYLYDVAYSAIPESIRNKITTALEIINTGVTL